MLDKALYAIVIISTILLVYVVLRFYFVGDSELPDDKDVDLWRK